MTITRDLLTALRTDINKALAEVAAKHGVVLDLGNCRFDATSGTFKLTVAKVSAERQADVAAGVASPGDARAAEDFTRLAGVYGLKPEWLGKSYGHGRSRLTVIGLLPSKHKNNILVQGTEGGRYVVPHSELIAYMSH